MKSPSATHHDLKTFGLWDADHHPDDSITWTSGGTGRQYRTRPKEWITGIAEPPTGGTPRTDSGPEESKSDEPPPF